jgi:hypothetical protein
MGSSLTPWKLETERPIPDQARRLYDDVPIALRDIHRGIEKRKTRGQHSPNHLDPPLCLNLLSNRTIPLTSFQPFHKFIQFRLFFPLIPTLSIINSNSKTFPIKLFSSTWNCSPTSPNDSGNDCIIGERFMKGFFCSYTIL